MLFISNEASGNDGLQVVALPRADDPKAPSLVVKDEKLKQLIFPILTRGQALVLQGDESTAFLQIKSTLLLRPTQDRPGFVAYHLPPPFVSQQQPNRRATCLAMTCGLFRCRFFGNVLIDIISAPGSTTLFLNDKESLLETLYQVALAGAVVSPDHRLWKPLTIDDDAGPAIQRVQSWILGAAHENYHDQDAVQRWAQITSRRRRSLSKNKDSDSETTDGNDEQHGHDDGDTEGEMPTRQAATESTDTQHGLVTKEPLCLHCRRPTQHLCDGCKGAYFCEAPRHCQIEG